MNLSVSGAFIGGDFDLRLLSRIQVVIEMPLRGKHRSVVISSYVIRKSRGGVGIEWCEFAPKEVGDFLGTLAVRPHVRIRRHDAAPVATLPRISAPLLRHGVR